MSAPFTNFMPTVQPWLRHWLSLDGDRVCRCPGKEEIPRERTGWPAVSIAAADRFAPVFPARASIFLQAVYAAPPAARLFFHQAPQKPQRPAHWVQQDYAISIRSSMAAR